MSASQVKIVATFSVNAFEAFTAIANEMTAYCKANEPDTLIYDWYVDVYKKEGRLLEVYRDTAAFRQHVTGKIFTEMAPRMMKAITWQSLEAYGDLPNEFDRVMKAFPSVHWAKSIAAL